MTGDVGAGDLYTLWNGAWDPHDPNRLVTAGGHGIQVHGSLKWGVLPHADATSSLRAQA